MEYVEANVFAKVALVKLDQQIRPPFSPDEIQRLLGSLDRTSLPGCRNHVLLSSSCSTPASASRSASPSGWLCQISDNGALQAPD